MPQEPTRRIYGLDEKGNILYTTHYLLQNVCWFPLRIGTAIARFTDCPDEILNASNQKYRRRTTK